jgi:hypothetical protein
MVSTEQPMPNVICISSLSQLTHLSFQTIILVPRTNVCMQLALHQINCQRIGFVGPRFVYNWRMHLLEFHPLPRVFQYSRPSENTPRYFPPTDQELHSIFVLIRLLLHPTHQVRLVQYRQGSALVTTLKPIQAKNHKIAWCVCRCRSFRDEGAIPLVHVSDLPIVSNQSDCGPIPKIPVSLHIVKSMTYVVLTYIFPFRPPTFTPTHILWCNEVNYHLPYWPASIRPYFLVEIAPL